MNFSYYCLDCGSLEFMGDSDNQEAVFKRIESHFEEYPDHMINAEITVSED